MTLFSSFWPKIDSFSRHFWPIFNLIAIDLFQKYQMVISLIFTLLKKTLIFSKIISNHLGGHSFEGSLASRDEAGLLSL